MGREVEEEPSPDTTNGDCEGVGVSWGWSRRKGSATAGSARGVGVVDILVGGVDILVGGPAGEGETRKKA